MLRINIDEAVFETLNSIFVQIFDIQSLSVQNFLYICVCFPTSGITQKIVEAGLSCDGYRGRGVTCTLSSWVCGQRGANWETRTLTLKYSNGRSSSRWESRSPCRGENIFFIRNQSVWHILIYKYIRVPGIL